MIYYKYLKPERIDVLSDLKIRYTQVSALNDPFESFPAIISESREWYWMRHKEIVSSEMESLGIKSESKRKQYFRRRKKEFPNWYACYTDEKWLLELSSDVQKMSASVQGLLSLSGTSRNILMWSHYAHNHTGYVIGFDGDHEYFGKSVSPVIYTDERPFVDPTRSKQSGNLFYTKSKDWAYEEEYRKFLSLVVTLPLESGGSFLPYTDADSKAPVSDEVTLFTFPKESISEVIVGWKSAPELLSGIMTALLGHGLGHIPVYRAVPDKTKYEMSIVLSEK
ncbi:MAG: DUF2971 domain-containing protein [Thermodesulfovibrionales bacterium]